VSAVACTREPVSWLRLERYALGELGADAARAIEVHVAECAACRGCLERIWGDDRPLPRLVLKRKPETLFDYRFEDFELLDYYAHGSIKAPIAV